MTAIETAILKLDRKLKDLPFKSAFVGGSVLSLLVTDPAACRHLRRGLAMKFVDYLACHDLEDAVEGFVQTEDNPAARKEAILSRFRGVAALLS